MAHPDVARLKESPIDRASSLIVTLLVFAGVVVVGLFSFWITFRLVTPTIATAPVRMTGAGGDPHGLPNEKLSLEGPDRDDLGHHGDSPEPGLQQTMQVVVDAAAKQVADTSSESVVKLESEADSILRGSHGNSPQPGFGDKPGVGGGGPEWEMKYDESTLAAYAQQLDHFKIELAVVGGTKDGIEYASSFTQGTPSRRTGTRDAEQALRPHRTYFSHSSGTVKSGTVMSGTVEKYDRQLLAKAGINAEGFGRIILQYYPKAAEDQLLIAQQQYRGLDQPAIKKTVFGIRRQGGGFEFFVIDQVRR